MTCVAMKQTVMFLHTCGEKNKRITVGLDDFYVQQPVKRGRERERKETSSSPHGSTWTELSVERCTPPYRLVLTHSFFFFFFTKKGEQGTGGACLARAHSSSILLGCTSSYFLVSRFPPYRIQKQQQQQWRLTRSPILSSCGALLLFFFFVLCSFHSNRLNIQKYTEGKERKTSPSYLDRPLSSLLLSRSTGQAHLFPLTTTWSSLLLRFPSSYEPHVRFRSPSYSEMKEISTDQSVKEKKKKSG